MWVNAHPCGQFDCSPSSSRSDGPCAWISCIWNNTCPENLQSKMWTCSLFSCVATASFLMALMRKSSCGKRSLTFPRHRRWVIFEPGCSLGLVCYSSRIHKSFIINLVSDKQSSNQILLTLNLCSVLQTEIYGTELNQGFPGLTVMKHRSAFQK